MRDEDKTVIGCLGALLYVAIFSPLSAMLYGWTLAKMWTWFIVPVFHLPPLSVAYAIGIAYTIRLVTYQQDAVKKEEEKETWVKLVESTLMVVLICGVTLGCGYIVKQFT